MTQWTELDPGAGDTGSVSTWAAREAADEGTASGIVSSLGSALAGQSSYWTGAGARSWAATMVEQKTDIERLQQASNTVAAAARVYASAVDDIQRAAATQIALLNSGRLAANQTYLDDASNPPSDAVLRRRTADHDDAQSQVRGAESSLKALAAQRKAADSAFAAALHGAVSPTWPAERAAFLAVGIAHPDRLSITEIDRRVDDYIRGLDAEGGKHYTEQEAQAVLVFATQGAITPAQVTSLFQNHPALAEKLASVDPTVVAGWWKSMDAFAEDDSTVPSRAQQALVTAIPAALGNLDGVAYWARDGANRHELDAGLTAAKTALADFQKNNPPPMGQYGQGEYQQKLAWYQNEVASYQQLKKSLRTDSSTGAARQLVSLLRNQPPLAAVSIGDLDTASDVTYMVPGMGSSTATMTGWTDASRNVFKRQVDLTGSDDRAVVAWVNYKSPPVPGYPDLDLGVLHGDSARAGAQQLDADLTGLNATRPGTGMSLNVVSHSYGTTTASLALAEKNLHVHSFVSVASAGIEKSIKEASDIHANQVYAEQARAALPVLENGQGDQYAWTGRDFSGRQNPMDSDFGAIRFNSSGAGTGLNGVTAHDGLIHGDHNPHGYGYFDNNTESLNNIALATTGQGDQVSAYHAQPLTPLQQAWVTAAEQGETAW